jgi:hypothetical protein
LPQTREGASLGAASRGERGKTEKTDKYESSRQYEED